MLYLPTILCTALGIAMMLLPHHRKPLVSDRTLLETLRGLPSGIMSAPRASSVYLLLGVGIGCLAPLAPAVLTLLLALTPPAADPISHQARLILSIAAPILFLLAALCSLVIAFSGLVISFGVSSNPWSRYGHLTAWYLFAAALTAALAAIFPATFANVYHFSAPR